MWIVVDLGIKSSVSKSIEVDKLVNWRIVLMINHKLLTTVRLWTCNFEDLIVQAFNVKALLQR